MTLRKNKILLLISISLLIISNLIWLIDKYKTIEKEKYDNTYDCEQSELIYCLNKFTIGITYNNFITIIKKESLNISNEVQIDKNQTIEIRNILNKCPKSGRPYCGIVFSFENKKLTNIETGYPCH